MISIYNIFVTKVNIIPEYARYDWNLGFIIFYNIIVGYCAVIV